MSDPYKLYTKRQRRYARLSSLQSNHANLVSNIRLFSFITGLGLAIFLYRQQWILGIVMFLVTLGIFTYLVVLHNKLLTHKRLSSALEQINQKCLQRLNGEWLNFADTGGEFRDPDHPYSGDLDLFGQGSLFQLINTTQTFLGRGSLKDSLVKPSENKQNILQRQEAIVELSRQTTWRQRFEAEGRVVAGQLIDPESLFNWARQRNPFYCQPWLKYAVRALPVITSLFILLHFVVLHISPLFPIVALVFQFFLLTLYNKERNNAFKTVDAFESSTKVYTNLLQLLESKGFNSPLLQELQGSLRNKSNQPASLQVRALSKIVNSLSNRNNAMFFFINILTLWDYQCMIALETWKAESGSMLHNWLNTLAQVEVLSSLSTLKADNPEWVIPEIIESPPIYTAKQLGHPLLRKGRVNNDIRIDRSSGILLITGSNMSGKSTLLRTVGINLVLAFTGAPVCARKFQCSLMSLYTCMRVSDNLEQSISSFYAELLRIKQIVNGATTERQIFFLLDEIFKGTNSQDRHTGAKLLIKQLAKQGAIGLVSTHDLELGMLEQETAGRVRNYHFEEYYHDNQINFDYKLRPGLSTTRNALYLIKLAGIETGELS